MRGRVVTSILLLTSITLIGVSLYLINQQDVIPPIIEIGEKKLTYCDGEAYEKLLIDVTARDNKDGDLSSEVFVDRVIGFGDDKRGIVIYGVIDSSKNVTTKQRIVDFVVRQETDVEQEETQKEVIQASLEPDGEKPAIRLKEEQVEVKVGEKFTPVSYVEEVIDDSDTREDLFKHIHVEGDYNVKEPGNYKIQFYVTDSQGNASKKAIMILHVI